MGMSIDGTRPLAEWPVEGVIFRLQRLAGWISALTDFQGFRAGPPVAMDRKDADATLRFCGDHCHGGSVAPLADLSADARPHVVHPGKLDLAEASRVLLNQLTPQRDVVTPLDYRRAGQTVAH